MRHCRQCRADAVGRLSEDRFAEFTAGGAPARAGPGRAGACARRAARRSPACERGPRASGTPRCAASAAVPASLSARVAVATRGGGQVDEHFGHARELLVYDVSRAGARLVGRRAIERYCAGGEGEDDALAATLRALEGCRAVLVAKIGRCPRSQLAAAGIEAVDRARVRAHRGGGARLVRGVRGQGGARRGHRRPGAQPGTARGGGVTAPVEERADGAGTALPELAGLESAEDFFAALASRSTRACSR